MLHFNLFDYGSTLYVRVNNSKVGTSRESRSDLLQTSEGEYYCFKSIKWREFIV